MTDIKDELTARIELYGGVLTDEQKKIVANKQESNGREYYPHDVALLRVYLFNSIVYYANDFLFAFLHMPYFGERNDDGSYDGPALAMEFFTPELGRYLTQVLFHETYHKMRRKSLPADQYDEEAVHRESCEIEKKLFPELHDSEGNSLLAREIKAIVEKTLEHSGFEVGTSINSSQVAEIVAGIKKTTEELKRKKLRQPAAQTKTSVTPHRVEGNKSSACEMEKQDSSVSVPEVELAENLDTQVARLRETFTSRWGGIWERWQEFMAENDVDKVTGILNTNVQLRKQLEKVATDVQALNSVLGNSTFVIQLFNSIEMAQIMVDSILDGFQSSFAQIQAQITGILAKSSAPTATSPTPVTDSSPRADGRSTATETTPVDQIVSNLRDHIVIQPSLISERADWGLPADISRDGLNTRIHGKLTGQTAVALPANPTSQQFRNVWYLLCMVDVYKACLNVEDAQKDAVVVGLFRTLNIQSFIDSTSDADFDNKLKAVPNNSPQKPLVFFFAVKKGVLKERYYRTLNNLWQKNAGNIQGFQNCVTDVGLYLCQIYEAQLWSIIYRSEGYSLLVEVLSDLELLAKTSNMSRLNSDGPSYQKAVDALPSGKTLSDVQNLAVTRLHANWQNNNEQTYVPSGTGYRHSSVRYPGLIDGKGGGATKGETEEYVKKWAEDLGEKIETAIKSGEKIDGILGIFRDKFNQSGTGATFDSKNFAQSMISQTLPTASEAEKTARVLACVSLLNKSLVPCGYFLHLEGGIQQGGGATITGIAAGAVVARRFITAHGKTVDQIFVDAGHKHYAHFSHGEQTIVRETYRIDGADVYACNPALVDRAEQKLEMMYCPVFLKDVAEVAKTLKRTPYDVAMLFADHEAQHGIDWAYEQYRQSEAQSSNTPYREYQHIFNRRNMVMGIINTNVTGSYFAGLINQMWNDVPVFVCFMQELSAIIRESEGNYDLHKAIRKDFQDTSDPIYNLACLLVQKMRDSGKTGAQIYKDVFNQTDAVELPRYTSKELVFPCFGDDIKDAVARTCGVSEEGKVTKALMSHPRENTADTAV